MQSDRELMQQALEALTAYDGTNGEGKRKRVLAALRERLAQPDAYGYASRLAVAIWKKHYMKDAPQWKPLDDLMGVLTQIDNMTSGLTRLAQPEFDSDLQSAAMTQTAAKLAQPEQSPLDRMADNARELGLDYEPVQEPVAHSIVAGALFDFMGWLTTRRERLVLSSSDDAAPAADAIKNFAQMRSLSINDAQVQRWQEHLADSQPRQWVGLTNEQIRDLWIENHNNGGATDAFARAIEAKLKEKNV